jgi:hypothetical protein
MTLERTVPQEELDAAANDPDLNKDLAFKFANAMKQGDYIFTCVYIYIIYCIFICMSIHMYVRISGFE